MTSSRVPAIYGAATFGSLGRFAKVEDVAEAQKYIDLLVSHGHNAIDTSRVYGAGTSEEVISKLDLKDAFVVVDSKIFPVKPGDHSPKRLKELVKESVAALNGVKIRTMYLHKPDPSVPFEETVGAIDELYKQGLFESFGLSNYLSWEVSEIVTICRLKGYVAPTVYQGIYNFIDRVNEAELFPCLRRFNIRFAAFSPLAGGLLTGIFADQTTLDANLRFNPASGIPWYRTRYAHATPVLQRLQSSLAAHQLTLREVAARWLVHHSQLRPDDLGIIYGASKLSQLEEALVDHAKGPLPEVVLTAVENAWLELKPYVPLYNMP
ncbi:aflatoxin B1-aldehyde reductase [Multifurca ochricompacta]|uniref:Aflatoxin B1-aldehyde reductase n=1 Tax=Multifurca ochricompacta TaxID=376703 RepID=A0AAD4ME50_9AGAM|nr:aflatoxin B1-aldehyde reductase [Multifurca ochricompacta]